jgi:O-antigen/teichoic acid export membrane protein
MNKIILLVVNSMKKKTDSFIKASFIMTAAGILGGMLGYFYQILMGRLLKAEEYSLLSAIMSLTSIVLSPFGAIALLTVREFSKKEIIGDNLLSSYYYRIFYKNISVISAIFIVIIICFFRYIGEYLKADDPYIIYLFCLIVVMNIYYSLNMSYIQGKQNYKVLSLLPLLNLVLKIIISSVAIYLNYKIYGVLWAIFISTLIFYLISFRYISFKEAHLSGSIIKFSFNSFIKSAIPLIIASTCFMLMTQADILFVNYFFSKNDTAEYAAASVLGKAILYLPGGVISVMFPMVSSSSSNKEKINNLLKRSCVATLFFCIIVALIYFFFSSILVNFFYGNKFPGAAYILKWYGFALIPMALIMVLEHHLMAINKFLYTWIFLVIAPLQIIFMINFHKNIIMVPFAIFVSGIIILITGVVFSRIITIKVSCAD